MLFNSSRRLKMTTDYSSWIATMDEKGSEAFQ
jgi:hypothetical protein